MEEEIKLMFKQLKDIKVDKKRDAFLGMQVSRSVVFVAEFS